MRVVLATHCSCVLPFFDVDPVRPVVACDSYEISGVSSCSEGLIPAPDGDGIVCSGGICDDETCCVEGEVRGMAAEIC